MANNINNKRVIDISQYNKPVAQQLIANNGFSITAIGGTLNSLNNNRQRLISMPNLSDFVNEGYNVIFVQR